MAITTMDDADEGAKWYGMKRQALDLLFRALAETETWKVI